MIYHCVLVLCHPTRLLSRLERETCCTSVEEVRRLSTWYHSNTVWLGPLDSWTSAGIQQGCWESIEHCYLTVISLAMLTDYDLRHLKTWCVSVEKVRWLSLDITPIQFDCVPWIPGPWLVRVPWLLGVNLALLSHSS